MQLIEKVARVLCRTSAALEAIDPEPRAMGYSAKREKLQCSICKDEGCSLWETFIEEAKEAVLTIRKHDRGK